MTWILPTESQREVCDSDDDLDDILSYVSSILNGSKKSADKGKVSACIYKKLELHFHCTLLYISFVSEEDLLVLFQLRGSIYPMC